MGAVSLDREGELTVSLARAVVLACGGAGQVFSHTTNPAVATGDGHAMAYRAGAVMRDMEFMQFHPTAFYGTENPTLLLTEALRGEGAYLLDDAGERFMVGSHPRAELAPRDVVVRHMKRVFDRDKTDHVWLDARHLECGFLRERFPTVYTGLQKRGFDLCTQLIPVAPASHYFIGGVLTDIWGRTTIPGLYACGETASTGIHGANRLASNSLLEGLVFGERTVRDLNRYLSVADPAVRKVRLDLADETREGNDPAVVDRGQDDRGPGDDGPVRHRSHAGGSGAGPGDAGGAAAFAGSARTERGGAGAVQPAHGRAAHRRDGRPSGREPWSASALRLPRAGRRSLAPAHPGAPGSATGEPVVESSAVEG